MGGMNTKPQKAMSSLLALTEEKNTLISSEKKDKLETSIRIEGALDEAWDYKVLPFPNELTKLILGYSNDDFNFLSTPYPRRQHSSFTLFNHNPYQKLQERAITAANAILLCRTDTVLELVTQNPSILLYKLPVVIDPIKRPLLSNILTTNSKKKSNKALAQIIPYKNKTLLQIAAAEGDINLLEKLVAYLPEEEAYHQLREHFPIDWEERAALWLQPYQDAIHTFLNTLVTTKIPNSATYITLTEKYKPTKQAMWVLRQAFALTATKEVTTGFRLSPQVHHFALQLIRDSLDKACRAKVDFYAIMVYGFLQELSLACDAPFIFNYQDSICCFDDLGTRLFHSMGDLGDTCYKDYDNDICRPKLSQAYEDAFQTKILKVQTLLQGLKHSLQHQEYKQSTIAYTAA